MKTKNVSSIFFVLITLVSIFLSGCNHKKEKASTLIPVILDTDANNELDDQHALAYLVFNSNVFDVIGITVNATYNGGNIEGHYKEAERVLELCTVKNLIPLYSGANANFTDIQETLSEPDFDGFQAVDFIINEARKERDQKLVLIPIGKLTNIALALEKAPDISNKVRIVWLGSNYPEPGEYNQDNDIPSLNSILNTSVEFEMVTVRYGLGTGSAAVSVTPLDMETHLPGAGPLSTPVEGRHGGTFTHFGDYSIDLFRHIDLHGNPPSRSLFDVVAVAVVKNQNWGEKTIIPAPIMDMENNKWVERPENERTISVWENFDKQAILDDFFQTIKAPNL